MTTADQHYLPPAPLGAPLDSVAWAEWYRKLREVAESGQQSLDNLTNIVEPELQNKLNKNAADVLGGEITFSSLGAFKVGNVTWNGSTVTGTGLLFSQYGIVGALSGSPKFVLKADGSATFGGQLTAATGTFVGSLIVGSSPAISGTTMTGSGAVINSNGTFALGTPTGNITYNGSAVTINGDLVTTGNITNSAVTQLTYDMGNDILINDLVEHEVASATLPTYTNAPASKVLINVYALLTEGVSATGGVVVLHLYKNGVKFQNEFSRYENCGVTMSPSQTLPVSWQCVDSSPSSGAVYSVRAVGYTAALPFQVRDPRLSLILFKK